MNLWKKKSLFWSVIFSYSTQQWTISWLDCDVWQKVNFIWWPVMTSSVAGLRRSSKAVPKAKLVPKKIIAPVWLSVPIWSTTLYEYQWSHYIWEVCSANQWDALKTAMPASGIGKQNRPNSSIWQSQPHDNQHFKSWIN